MSDLTLWVDAFWTSPYAFAVFVALEEKQLPYQVKTVALQRGEQRAADYVARSLTGRVPMLRHGDFHLSESSAMVEYLEETFPATPHMLPEDRQQRARARQLMAWIRSDFFPIREERPTSTIFYEPATSPLSPEAERDTSRLLTAADLLVREGQRFLFGRFGTPDADLALMLQRLAHSGHLLTPKLRAFVDGVWSRPSVQKFVTQQRPPYERY
jgi:glutathione S-transferase